MIATWRLHAYVWYSKNTTSEADEVEYITSPSENTLITSQTYIPYPKNQLRRESSHIATVLSVQYYYIKMQ